MVFYNLFIYFLIRFYKFKIEYCIDFLLSIDNMMYNEYNR